MQAPGDLRVPVTGVCDQNRRDEGAEWCGGTDREAITDQDTEMMPQQAYSVVNWP